MKNILKMITKKSKQHVYDPQRAYEMERTLKYLI